MWNTNLKVLFCKMFYGIGIILLAVLVSNPSFTSGKFCSRFRIATLAKPDNWRNGDCVPSETIFATKARSSIQCSSMCLRRFPECNSIRYDKVSKSCELLACMMLPKRKNKNCMTYGINLSYDCSEILETSPSSQSGVYPITNNNETKTWPVYCDMDTDDGGWTVFQKRQSKSTDFDRPWVNYKNGFGTVCDFWLGNDLIHQITASGWYSLRLDMTTTSGDVYFAKYASFTINGESDKYRLGLGALIDANAGDVLRSASGHIFSTNDNDDTSKHCPVTAFAGWWYTSCYSCLLNGRFNLNFRCSINSASSFPMLSNSEMKIKRY